MYLTEIKKEKSSMIFLITANENLLHSKNLITFPKSSSFKVLNSVPETDKQCPPRNIHISQILTLIKTHSQKLGYILKLFALVYTLDSNVSWV